MKCARLHLQDRSKVKSKSDNPKLVDKPRRYCQKRLVNPQHEEDPRWSDVLERFHCNIDIDHDDNQPSNTEARHENEYMFLTVQTLQFQGDAEQEPVRRPRTSFKYRTVTDQNKHRMFVKQPVTDDDLNDDDRSSEHTCYYFDDYVKYLLNNDRSRPTSGKSSIYLRRFSANIKENKATQVDLAQKHKIKKPRGADVKGNHVIEITPKNDQLKEHIGNGSKTINDAKITYIKSGKSKSLTISRAQSPETLQVIRVDVVCNYDSRAMSEHEDIKKNESSTSTSELKFENISVKNSHFANKYLLTNTVKTLDQKLSGGAKVTLLCKTFKLADRSKLERSKMGTDRKHTRALKDVTRNDIKVKSRKQLMK